jgi:hypothetical protein
MASHAGAEKRRTIACRSTPFDPLREFRIFFALAKRWLDRQRFALATLLRDTELDGSLYLTNRRYC